MAEPTLTLVDTEDGEVRVDVDLDIPPLPLEEEPELTPAQKVMLDLHFVFAKEERQIKFMEFINSLEEEE